jgi:hypothetical protein
VRSFLTRFPNSRTGVVLLIPGLLFCLACATPLPFENLQEGMTAEAVRAGFGEPESSRGSAWYYTHEEKDWFALYFDDANKLDRWEFGSNSHANPAAEDSAAIGIAVKLRSRFNLLGLFTFAAHTVYFVRVERRDILSGDLIHSNFARGGRVYLLNAPRGEYVAVGARYTATSQDPSTGFYNSPTHTVFFSHVMIEATRTIAAPGELAFMGAWLARQHSLDRAEQAQRHYAKLIKPGVFDRNWIDRLFPVNHASHPEKEDRSDTARASFFGAARGDFGKTPWVDWLGASAP